MNKEQQRNANRQSFNMPIEDKINLSPLKKYKKYSRFPWKLTLHLILIAFTSYQAFVIAKSRNQHTRSIRDVYQYIFLQATDERNNIQFYDVPDFQQYFQQLQILLSNLTQYTLFKLDDSQALYQLNTDFIQFNSNNIQTNLSVKINISQPIIYPFNLSDLVSTRNYIKQAKSMSLIVNNYYSYWSNNGDEEVQTCLNWTLTFSFSFSQKGAINGFLYTQNQLCANQDIYHSGLNYFTINLIVLTFSTISFVLYVIYLYRIGIEYLKGKLIYQNLSNVVRKISNFEQDNQTLIQNSIFDHDHDHDTLIPPQQQKDQTNKEIKQQIDINLTESQVSNNIEEIQLDSEQLRKLQTIEENESEAYPTPSIIKKSESASIANIFYLDSQQQENNMNQNKQLQQDQQKITNLQSIFQSQQQNQFQDFDDRKVNIRIQRCLSNTNQPSSNDISPSQRQKRIIQMYQKKDSLDIDENTFLNDYQQENFEQAFISQDNNINKDDFQEKLFQINQWFILGLLSNFFQILGSFIAIIDTFSDSELDAFIQKETLVGIGATLAWVTVLQYLGYNDNLNVMNKTLYISFKNIMWFFLGVFPWFFGFVFFAQVIFYQYQEFSSIEVSLVTLFSMTWGDSINQTFLEVQAEGLMGWIFLIVFLLIFYTAIQNIFVNIILNGYEIMREENVRILRQKVINTKYKNKIYAPNIQINKLEPIINAQLHNKFESLIQQENFDNDESDDKSLILCKLQLNIQRMNYLITEMARIIQNDVKKSELLQSDKEYFIKDYLVHLENIQRHIKIHIVNSIK